MVFKEPKPWRQRPPVRGSREYAPLVDVVYRMAESEGKQRLADADWVAAAHDRIGDPEGDMSDADYVRYELLAGSSGETFGGATLGIDATDEWQIVRSAAERFAEIDKADKVGDYKGMNREEVVDALGGAEAPATPAAKEHMKRMAADAALRGRDCREDGHECIWDMTMDERVQSFVDASNEYRSYRNELFGDGGESVRRSGSPTRWHPVEFDRGEDTRWRASLDEQQRELVGGIAKTLRATGTKYSLEQAELLDAMAEGDSTWSSPLADPSKQADAIMTLYHFANSLPDNELRRNVRDLVVDVLPQIRQDSVKDALRGDVRDLAGIAYHEWLSHRNRPTWWDDSLDEDEKRDAMHDPTLAFDFDFSDKYWGDLDRDAEPDHYLGEGHKPLKRSGGIEPTEFVERLLHSVGGRDADRPMSHKMKIQGYHESMLQAMAARMSDDERKEIQDRISKMLDGSVLSPGETEALKRWRYMDPGGMGLSAPEQFPHQGSRAAAEASDSLAAMARDLERDLKLPADLHGIEPVWFDDDDARNTRFAMHNLNKELMRRIARMLVAAERTGSDIKALVKRGDEIGRDARGFEEGDWMSKEVEEVRASKDPADNLLDRNETAVDGKNLDFRGAKGSKSQKGRKSPRSGGQHLNYRYARGVMPEGTSLDDDTKHGPHYKRLP